MDMWASDFFEIPSCIAVNTDIRDLMLDLLAGPMPGKATEGGDREVQTRSVLKELILGQLTLEEAYQEVSLRLPRESSTHAEANRVFPLGWEERLIRTQLSQLYNHGVLKHIINSGGTRCFVPQSSAEKHDSQCSVQLAGSEHDATELRDRLVQSYVQGNWSKDLKIPDHPHCTHVVRPLDT